jgi:thiamine-phosphate pyrophosphorylase
VVDPRALRLVAITDDLRDGVDGLVARAAAAARGGATMVQLRLKDESARTLVEVARALVAALSVPVIVNDRADVALAAGAAGVHLGADDVPVSAIRRVAPASFTIGASVGSEEEVPRGRDADYVGIGPLYATTSKSDAGTAIGVEGFRALARACAQPALAIGGLTVENAGAVIGAGAAGIAVIRAIFAAPDPESAARALRTAIER